MTKLGRSKKQREHLLTNLSQSLVRAERLVTTLPKAKAAGRVVSRWLTAAQRAQQTAGVARLGAERRLARVVGSRAVLRKLIDDLAVRVSKRPGGYVRIIKLGPRVGDGTPRALAELVDRPVKETQQSEATKNKLKN